MTNYREILRLDSLGISKKDIAASCGCARNTVASVLQRAAEYQLKWPLSDGMSNIELALKLFSSVETKSVYKMPDY